MVAHRPLLDAATLDDALLPCRCDLCGFTVSHTAECVVCGRWGCLRDMRGRVCIDCDDALGESEVGAW